MAAPPHPAAERSTRVLLAEGEPDMIAAWSRGPPAIAVPGVDGWRPAWARFLGGRVVTVMMDCDEQGRAARRRSAAISRRSATSECSTSRLTETTAMT